MGGGGGVVNIDTLEGRFYLIRDFSSLTSLVSAAKRLT